MVNALIECGSAHKAAYPDRYKVKDKARSMYPAYEGIESRYGLTKEHLQIWDGERLSCSPSQALTTHPYMPDAAHMLPTLFSFTTPAKYCYRAIATFCKFATDMFPPPSSQMLSPLEVPLTFSPPSSPPASPLSRTFYSLSSSSGIAASASSSATIPGRERPFRA